MTFLLPPGIKRLRIMSFQSKDSHSSPLFRFNHILKLQVKILIENILFINKSFNSLLPEIFKSWSIFCSDLHNYHTVSSTADKIFKPFYRTDSYGKNSIILGAINSWNKTQHQFSNLSFKAFRPNKLKVYFSKNALESINEEVKGVIFIKETSLL